MKTEHEREQEHLASFAKRVQRAAAHIGAGRPITRSLDNCFESYDGEAVAHALFRRAARNPETKLAQNLQQYLCGEANEAARINGPNMTHDDLRALSLKNFRDAREQWARMRRDQEKRNASYRAELTPEGEQSVIPGCERNASPKARQLDLFG